MLISTKTAVTAILQADPSLDGNTIKFALSVLERNADLDYSHPASPRDRILSRKEVAEILGCSPHTVSAYGRRGRIHRVLGGADGKRATGYSEQSVVALLSGKGRSGNGK